MRYQDGTSTFRPREYGAHVGRTAGSCAVIEWGPLLDGNLNCHVASPYFLSLQGDNSKRSIHHICMQGLVDAALPGPDSASSDGMAVPAHRRLRSDCNLTAVLVRRLEEL